MLADRENIETRLVGELCRGEDVRQALLGGNGLARLRVRRELSEGIKPQLEPMFHRIGALCRDRTIVDMRSL
jgi:hypothetical protein